MQLMTRNVSAPFFLVDKHAYLSAPCRHESIPRLRLGIFKRAIADEDVA
jgi:hypothetical protein